MIGGNVIMYLFFTFIIYSFAGWIIEELYSKYSTGRFKKDGFLKEPLKPMYGIAITILIIYYEFLEIRGIPFIFFCLIVPTTVEYISGYLLKHLFNKVYWDYSDLKHNINGYISLIFSIYWCILSYIGVVYLNPLITSTYLLYGNIINPMLLFLGIIFVLDFMVTINKYYNHKKYIDR